MKSTISPVPLESILRTEELNRRAPRQPDYASENVALVALTRSLANSPDTILQTLAESILDVLKAGSAGVSLLTENEERFYWPAIAGLWQAHIGGGTPRNFGPCGDVLDCNAPLLLAHVERRYAYFEPVTPPVEECLLVPFYVAGKAVGTIWAVAHDVLRKFDSEDLRQLENLGLFASAAYQAQTMAGRDQRHAALKLEDALQTSHALEQHNAQLLLSANALRRSEAELRDFVENASVGLQWVGPDGSVLWANQTELDLLGYTREEYIGHNITEFYADRAVIEDMLVRLTGGETLHDHEARMRCKDGSIRHVVVSSNAYVEDGKFGHTRCFTRDITARKQAEAALKASEDRVGRALDAAQLGTFNIDIATNTLITDKRFLAIFGTTSERIGYDGAFATVHPDDRQQQRDAVAAATRSDNPAPYNEEYRVVHPDGTLRWVFAKGRANFAEQGTVRRLASLDGTVADITDRKRAEESLRASEEFNRSIIDSSPDCIKVLDLEGNLLSMLSGQALLGIEDIRPFLNKSWVDFWEGVDRQAAQAAVTLAAAGTEGHFDGFFRTGSGESKWWDVAITPILDANGKPERLLSVSRDVTQRRRAELNLAFLAGVSHDLVLWTNVDEMMRIVGAKIAAHFKLSLCAFVEIDEAADQAVIHHDWHRDDVPSLIGVHRLGDFVGEEFTRLARAGKTIVVRNTGDDARTSHETFNALKIGAFICEPLIRDEQWRFALCLYHSAPYDWRQDEIELTRELTARIWTRLERLRAEEALRGNEWRLRNAMDSARLTFVEVDLERGGARTADNFAAVMGYASPPEQEADVSVGTRLLLEHIVPHDRLRVQAALDEFIGGKPVGRIDYQVLGDDQIVRWIESRWSISLETDGRPLKSFATNFDVTERKHAEEALRTSEQRYRNLFNSMDQGYCIIELIFDQHQKPVDWLYLDVNPAFEKLSTMHGAVGKRIREMVPDLEQYWFDGYGNVALTGEPIRFLNEAKPLDRWFDVYAFRLGGPGTKKIAVLFTDITERTKTEDALRQSEARFRALFDRGPIGMYSCDLSGKTIAYNRVAVELWGLEPKPGESDEQLRGSFQLFLTDGTPLPIADTPMTQVLQGKVSAVHDQQIMFARPDGSRITVVANIVPLKNERGEITGAIDCFYDITERSLLEKKTFEQAEALTDLHRRKDEFLAMLSHELRNPLAPISNAVHLLRLQKNEDPIQQQARSIIER